MLFRSGDSFPITVHGNGIYIFSKQIIVLLLLKVTLAVHQVIGSIQILCLKIFSGILLSEFDVLYVNGCLTHLVAFVQSVENGNAQGESHSIGAIPMVGRAGMEPMVSFVRIGREHPASRQAQGGDVTVADYCFLLLCELFL